MKINITKAQADEWEIIQKFNNEVFHNDIDHDDDLDLDWLHSEVGIQYYKDLASGNYGNCLIARVGIEPVGYIALAVKDFGYRKSKYVEIENIGVSPEYRSQGIGDMLIESAAGWAKEIKATRLYVAAYWKNTKAIKFYKRVGFTEIGLELQKIL